MGEHGDNAAPLSAAAASSSTPPSAPAGGSSAPASSPPAAAAAVHSSTSASASATGMSVLRALDEVSVLDKRIAKKTAEFVPMGVVAKKGRAVSNVEQFNATAKSDWHSITCLIARRNRLKSAILLSNATTVVRVAGESLTVAEVLERRKALQLQRELVGRLRAAREQTLRAVEQHNAQMEADLQKLLELHFGKGGNARPNSGDIDDISRPFRETNAARAADPLSADARIRELEEYVDQFDRECKFTLSEANACSRIYVE